MTDNATPVNEKDENKSSSPKKEKESSTIADLISTIVGGAAGAFVGGVSNPFSGSSSSAESISSGGSSISSALNSTPSGGNSGTTGESQFGGDDAAEKSTIEVLSKIYKVLSETNSTTNQIHKDVTTLSKNQTQQDISSDLSAINARARQNERVGTSSPVYTANGKKAEKDDKEDSSILGSIADWFTGGKNKIPKTGPSAADKIKKKGILDSAKDSFSGWGKKEAEKGTAKKIEKSGEKGILDKLKDAFGGPNVKKNIGKAIVGGAAALGVEEELRAQGITDPYAIEAFKGKAMSESGGKGGSEGDWTHTDNSKIRHKFPQLRNKSDQELNDLKSRGNETFLDEAYKSGGGYKYRGRGLIQLTGKSNYAAADKELGLNGELVNNPDILLTDKELDKKVSVWYYKRGLGKKKDFTSQEEANKNIIEIVGGKNYSPETNLGREELNRLNKIQESGKTKQISKNEFPANNTEKTNVASSEPTNNPSGYINTSYNPDNETASPFIPASYNPNAEPPTTFGGTQFASNQTKQQEPVPTPNAADNSKYDYYTDSTGKKLKENLQTGEETAVDNESGKLDAPKFMIRESKLAGDKTVNWKVDLESGEETLATDADLQQDKQQKELEKQYTEKQQSSSAATTKTDTGDGLRYDIVTPGEDSKVTTNKASSSKSPKGTFNQSETTTVTTTGGGSTLHVQEQSEEEKAKLAKEEAHEKELEKKYEGVYKTDSYKDQVNPTASPLSKKERDMLNEADSLDAQSNKLKAERDAEPSYKDYDDDKESADKDLNRLSENYAKQQAIDEKRNAIIGTQEYQEARKKQKSQGQSTPRQREAAAPPKSKGGGGNRAPRGNDDPTLKLMEEGANINHNGELTA
jgi:predicted chitinase